MLKQLRARRSFHLFLTPPAPRAFSFSPKAFVLFAFILALLLGSCTERSRLNPLDPKNPRTAGKPTGLRVIAELDTIRLSWDALALRDLTGYNVYRRLAHESGFYLLGQTSAQSNSLQDVSDRFGVAHFYRLTAAVGDLETLPSEEVTVTPGPTVTWVADSDSRAVIKLTHDGQHEILRSRAFFNPYRLRVDRRRGVIWVLEEYSGDFGSINNKGELLGKFDHFFEPVGLALDEEDGSIWVGDNGEHVLARFDKEGRAFARIDSLPELGALAFHASLQELWALTSKGELLLRVGKSSQLTRINLQPTWSGPAADMAVAANTGEAWVAGRNRVARVNQDGNVVFTATEEFRFASRLAIDQTRGACWVIDDSGEFRNNSSVYKLSAQGQVQFKIDGFERPQGLAVNPYDGSCYVLDTLQGRLVKITAEGIATNGYANFLTPFDIEVVMPVR
jgi:sugar lactone lactonase YvrE